MPILIFDLIMPDLDPTFTNTILTGPCDHTTKDTKMKRESTKISFLNTGFKL